MFRGTPQEFHYNPLGSVHGGYGATLLDSAMGCAVHSTLDAGDIYTTLEFKINFLRALTHETGRGARHRHGDSRDADDGDRGGADRGCARASSTRSRRRRVQIRQGPEPRKRPGPL